MSTHWQALTAFGMLACLTACATPVDTHPLASEPLGNSFFLRSFTDKLTDNAVVVALRSENLHGLLKVCGLYIFNGGGSERFTLESAMQNRQSILVVGTDKEAARIHTEFLLGYSAPPDMASTIISIRNMGNERNNIIALLKNINIYKYNAACVSTNAPWKNEYASAQFKMELFTSTGAPSTFIYTYHRK